MHLLYLDDSGSTSNLGEDYLILAGIAIYERATYWYEKKMNEIAVSVWPNSPRSIEFHGTEIFSGRNHWRGMKKDIRLCVYEQTLKVLEEFSPNQTRLFGAAIHKAAVSPQDPMEYAFEQLCSRFDQFLWRLHKFGNTQRGLIVLDKSTYETSLQKLAKNFRDEGHSWGQTRNLAEVPLFVDSKATRLIQFADLVAYALRQRYEHNESRYFDLISHRFDTADDIIHGLIHHAPPNQSCDCPSCMRRSN